MNREKILSLTRRDFIWETMRGSGKGGQNRNKRETAIRITHPPSGATAISCDEREQFRNKQIAFKRICKHPIFLNWCKSLIIKTKSRAELEKEIDESMKPENLKIEYGWKAEQ
jgi:protein subunit release factor B